MSQSKSRKKYDAPRRALPAPIKRAAQFEARCKCIACEVYGTEWEYHHIDGNRNNNDLPNIAYLCPTCHKYADKGTITRPALREKKEKLCAENETIQQLKVELAQYKTESVTTSPTYATAKQKYTTTFDSLADNTLFYQACIYLGPAIYLDERGDGLRAAIREVLGITEEEENFILHNLIQTGRAEKIGDLLVLKEKEDAKVALSEMIERGKVSVESLTQAFSNFRV